MLKEGLSGTIDEVLRHSISKLSNFHFVSNKSAKKDLSNGRIKIKYIYYWFTRCDLTLKHLPDIEHVA